MKLYNLFKKNQGTALFMSLMILSGVLIVSLGAASLILSGIKQSRTQIYSTKAYFAAEAGAERILWEVRKHGADVSSCVDGDYFNFGQSSAVCVSCASACDNYIYSLSNNASYNVVFINSGSGYILESVGNFQDVKRSVEISY